MNTENSRGWSGEDPHSPASSLRVVGTHPNVVFRRLIEGEKLRNSWGVGWGLEGYAWLSYKYVTSGLAVDWWTNIRAERVDTAQF